MKIHMKKYCAVLLCAAMLTGVFSVGASAAGPERPSAALGVIYDIGDFLLKGLLKGITALVPAVGIPSEFAESKTFSPGMEEFAEAGSEPGYQWRLGYADASLTDGLSDDLIKSLYVTGSLDPLGQRTVSEILDPPMVRVTLLSDDSQRGKVAFISIDAFGITSVDVAKIRAALAEVAEEHNIVSINVSALHQHSTIDTLGMNGNLIAGLFLNSLALVTGWYEPFSGKNTAYMNHLTALTATTVEKAASGMEPGTLYYGKTDVSEYITDKRAPEVFDPYMYRIRFVPDNEELPETWLGNVAIHTTGLGTSDTKVSSDWPYFIGEEVKAKTGANFQLILGAQLAMGMKNDIEMPEDATRYERVEAYGKALAQKLIAIDEEERLPSLLNVAHMQYTVEIDNPLHLLLFRLGAIESDGRKLNCLGTKMELRTEIGYIELGDKLAIALVPGEIEPALALGGSLSAEESYSGEAYEFPPMKDMVGDRDLMVFGLTNDQVGYIMLPNDIAHFVVFGNEEVNASSSQLADKTLKAFKTLVDSVR